MRQRLERYFEFESLKTNWRTEMLAGVTTFVTMAYIIFVNPSILQDAGMPFTARGGRHLPFGRGGQPADGRASPGTPSRWRRAWV